MIQNTHIAPMLDPEERRKRYNEAMAASRAEEMKRATDEGRRADEHLKRMQWRDAIIKRCRLPERHTENYGVAENSNCQPWRDVLAELRGQVGTGFLIALLGPRGTGKTQVATSLALGMIDGEIEQIQSAGKGAIPKIRYVKAVDIFREIRGSYGRDCDGPNDLELVRELSLLDLLIIDELQERTNSKFEEQTLTDVVDKRYDLQRDTLIISNLQPKEFGESIGPSIASRIQECGRAIVCSWQSFRQGQKTTPTGEK